MSADSVTVAARRSAGRRRLVRPMLATVLVATTGVLPTFLVGAIAVQLRRELHFGETGLGQALGLSFLLAAGCSILLGRTTERLGPVTSMRLAAAVSALSMSAVAAGARSLRSLSLLLVGAGLANAMSQPATNLYISRVVPPRRQGTAFAIKQSSIPAATLLGGLAVPGFALTVGWRWAFVAGAALAVAGGLAAVEIEGATGRGTGPGRRDQPIPVLAILGTGVGFGALAAASLGSFSTSSLHRAGFGEGTAGLLAAAGSALVIGVRLWLGVRSDRVRRPQFPIVASMMAVGSIGFAVMADMHRWSLIAGGLLTFTWGWGWTGLFNLSIAQANPSGPAAASGVTQTGTYLGVAAGPFVFGWLAEHVGYGAAYIAAAAASLAGAACVAVGMSRVIEPAIGRLRT